MIHIGILADYNPEYETHSATQKSFELAADALDISLQVDWIPTHQASSKQLGRYNALVIGTGAYVDREAVIDAILMARQNRVPTLGMCAGFQHMIIEYARNALGLDDVGHAEFDTDGCKHIIVPLECSLRGTEGEIYISPGSQTAALYDSLVTTERFYCSFGINQTYSHVLETSPFAVVGRDINGSVRIMELPDHPFFIGTLFVPQARALKGELHPLIVGLVMKAQEA